MTKLTMNKTKNVRAAFKLVLKAFAEEFELTANQKCNGLLEEYIRAAMIAGRTEKETVSAVRRNAKFYFSM